MSTELPKSFSPAEVEKLAADCWSAERLFHAEPTDPGTPYAVVIPPPNVTGALHLGHALNNTLQDILVRWRRMCGDNAVWLPGTDHAGIATQAVVEKRLLKEGKRRTDFTRDEFIAIVQEWKDEYEARILGQLKAMGCSCDFERTAFTMDELRAKAVREAFFRFFKDGLIYRGKRLVNWDPVSQTALSDDEVENREVDGFFYYLRYPIEDRGGTAVPAVSSSAASVDAPRHGRDARATSEYVTVATTRPETMLGDTAVAINPKDPRAASLRGKFVRLPIVNRVVPIIEDDYVVLPIHLGGDPADVKAQFATGFLKVTPAHDPNDYDIGQRHNLPTINVMAPDASISLDHGWAQLEPQQRDNAELRPLLGLTREDARKAVVQMFREKGLLEDSKPYKHSVGHSYRSHVPIEPYLSDQWYLKVTDERMAKAANAVLQNREGTAARGGTAVPAVSSSSGSIAEEKHRRDARATSVEFHPARYARMYETWHDNIRDWCISRQLWWGHRIPVWSLQLDADQGRPIGPGRFKELKLSLDRLFEVAGLPKRISIRVDYNLHRLIICSLDEESDRLLLELKAFWDIGPKPVGSSTPSPMFVRNDVRITQLANPFTPLFKALDHDPDVLDTWFSSALWPMSTLGWPDQSAIDNPQSAIQTWNPTSVLCTAREIITLWVSRMVMMNLYMLGRVPFRDVYIHAVIQDGDGRKMSKSLGNGVDPLDIIHSHGADAMRYTLSSMATNTQDVRLPVEPDPTTGRNTSPKFDIGKAFCTKLWNASRFVLMQLEKASDDGVRASACMSSTSESAWTMADRWIVSRFNRTASEVHDALSTYRFDQYAKAIYDFFWRDFCDWYVEAAKPQMRDDAQKAHTAQILATVLDGALRLMHPVIPHVTEVLWWKLNEVAPNRGLAGRIECPAGDRAPRIIRAPFPTDSKNYSEAAEHIFPRIQEVITTIRNVRNEYKIDAKRPVNVTIMAPGDAGRQIEALKPAIENMATCRLIKVAPDATPPANSVRAVADKCELYIEGLIDPAAEQARAGKIREDLEKKIATLRGRLSNEGYIARAPAKLVQETKDQLAAAEAELAKLS